MSWISRALRDLPIRQKLAITTTLAVAAALALTCAALLTYETSTVRRELKNDLASTAEMIGFSSAAGLSFRDADAVGHALRGLQAQPNIMAAAVYDAAGERFSQFQRIPDASFTWPAAMEHGEEFGTDRLDLYRAITSGGEKIGTVFIRSDLELMRSRMQRYALIATLVTLVATIGAVFIAGRLQRVISEPIAAVVGIAEQVAAGNDYGLRARRYGNDELGRLIDGFNHMLTQIQSRDAALQAAHNELEKRVAERTAELGTSLSLLNATLDSTNDGILATDRTGRVVCYNKRFAAMWNIAPTLLEQREDTEMQRVLAAQTRNPDEFLRRVGEIEREPERIAFDLIELADGRSLERYTHPQWLEGRIVGVVVSYHDVTERKRGESDLQRAHRELLETSRLAGMAEVATGVLHNVGNVLTSVNVSATIISDQVRHSKSGMVRKVSDLLREHTGDLTEFLTVNPRGRQLPEYLHVLAEHIAKEHTAVLSEIESLRKNIEHIRDIVAMQQNYAKVSGVAETVGVVELVEDALRMNAGALLRHEVTLVREFLAQPVITTEKHKVLQVLVNLIRNAKYACDEGGRSDKELRMRIAETAHGVQISVIDNGIGIPEENLTRIFAHGFTTRKDGHGFGLHSGALAAKELGGTLTVHSDGPGRGATFTLTLPFPLQAAA